MQNKPGAGSKKIDPNGRADFIINEHRRDIKFGLFGNISGKALHHKKIDFGEVVCVIPRQHANNQIILRSFWNSNDYLSCSSYHEDFVVGGIVDIRLYQYPEECKQAQNWIMRSVHAVDDILKNIPYPDPTTQMQIDPVPVIYYLPEYVYITENDDIKVGVWDEKEQTWTTEPIEELQYDKLARKLEFSTRQFGPIAYLQSRCTDYPYKRWKIRCVEAETAILDVETKRVTLTFELGRNYIKLIEKTDPEFKDILDKPMSPGELFLELQKCGINLMPVDDDAKLGGIHLKDRQAEENAIIDVATGLRSFAFRSCKWNKSINGENVVVKIRENLEFDREYFEDHEPDWRYVMWWPNKCAFVRCSDDAETCDTRLPNGHETHALLSLAIKGYFSEEAVDRCH